MGWRVSFYQADKETPVTIEEIIGEDDYEVAKINGEEIMYDQATDVWLELKSNEDFQKEIKCLAKNPEIDYYSITKEGFKMIILAYRDRVINHMKKQIEVCKNPDLKYEDYWRYDINILREMEYELYMWEWSYKGDDGSQKYGNINLHTPKGKFGISGSWDYKYGIFDLIEVYKYFDWDNYTMVVYGG